MRQYHQVAEVELAPMGGETLLYHPATKKFCVLNETAAYLWGALQEPSTEDQLLEKLCEGFDVADTQGALEDVRQTLQQFSDLQMVAVSE